jgi:hypothetical protein
MRTIGAIAATLIVLVAAAVYSNFGTLSPCGVLRERMRQQDGLAAILPDSIVDLVLAGQYGELSPSRCFAILMDNHNTAQASLSQPQPARPVQPAPPVPQPTLMDPQNPIQWAAQVTLQITNECRAKRQRGELPTYIASVQCSNPTMIAAFKEAHYKYMDLIEYFARKRLELAARIDRGELTEQQAQLEGNRLYASIQAAERQRDIGAR